MEELTGRPFYNQYAWAYDLIITPNVAHQCDFIEEMLSRRGVSQGARLLDAGCGTGRYAVELGVRGYIVDGLDQSSQLIAEAQKCAAAHALPLSFTVGDILALEAAPQYDAILCRGVLNDLLDESSRQEVFHVFARALRPAGVLVLDVREWAATIRRKTDAPVFEKLVETDLGQLAFRSLTELDRERRRLLVTERHALVKDNVETVSVYDFQMRCWTLEELEACLTRHGFAGAQYFGAYDARTAAGETDRLVCVAEKQG
ncbi:MAG TPA: class I SAM-dependent methyltransferase [Pyrinomonadaceae bacterium]